MVEQFIYQPCNLFMICLLAIGVFTFCDGLDFSGSFLSFLSLNWGKTLKEIGRGALNSELVSGLKNLHLAGNSQFCLPL